MPQVVIRDELTCQVCLKKIVGETDYPEGSEEDQSLAEDRLEAMMAAKAEGWAAVSPTAAEPFAACPDCLPIVDALEDRLPGSVLRLAVASGPG